MMTEKESKSVPSHTRMARPRVPRDLNNVNRAKGEPQTAIVDSKYKADHPNLLIIGVIITPKQMQFQ